MALPIGKLKETLVEAVRQIGNAHETLLGDNITIVIKEVDVTVNLIAIQGTGAVAIESVTVTPDRVSKSKQKSTQLQGSGLSTVKEQSQSDSIKTQTDKGFETQEYGRQTLGETRFQD
jgi:hypothetical protein